jgi:hypothetical protein
VGHGTHRSCGSHQILRRGQWHAGAGCTLAVSGLSFVLFWLSVELILLNSHWHRLAPSCQHQLADVRCASTESTASSLDPAPVFRSAFAEGNCKIQILGTDTPSFQFFYVSNSSFHYSLCNQSSSIYLYSPFSLDHRP